MGHSARRTAGLAGATVLLILAAPMSPAAASDIVPPKIMSMTPGGISIADTSFNYSVTEFSVGTLTLERFHHSVSKQPLERAPRVDPTLDPDTMFNGIHTSNNFDIFVTPSFVQYRGLPFPDTQHAKPIVHIGSSASASYRQDATFAANSPVYNDSLESGQATLNYVGTAWVYTDHEGVIYTFSTTVPVAGAQSGGFESHARRIDHINYPDGRVRTFTYDASNQLKMVQDSTGYAIIFDWSGGLIATACGFDLSQSYVTSATTCSGAALKVSYGYTSGQLTSATDVFGQVTTYTNASNGYRNNGITCIRPPGYTTCKMAMSYPGFQQVTQTLADGSVWQVGAGNTFVEDDDYVPTDGDNEATVTDPAGKVWHYAFTGSTPYSATDPNGNSSLYRYTGGPDYEAVGSPPTTVGSMLVEVDFPEGNKYLQENNGPLLSISKQTMKAKPGSGLADLVTTLTYTCVGTATQAACVKPTSKTDPRGNVTNWAYFDWGGIKSEMQPAPTTGAARPLKLYDYVQKYAYVKNSGGALVAAATPVWLPNSETDCQTVAGSSTPTCDGAAPQVVTTYEYGANGTADNLLLRGKVVTSGGVSMRTCYGYDAQSNRISETQPRGTTSLPVCP